ncbi:hypothetical protein DB347_16130 [Opitutaceae bacterium EW11]|nr:hypothetical protein DB347_16130 [Opitutaceae bacterium EW11]
MIAGMRPKILCIVFKFLGDVVVAIPALRALRQHKPDAEIHVLVAEDALPLVKTLPWIDRAWAFPRTRGKARLRDSLPVIRALRRERFDLSVDFVGNDRGSLLSLGVGARHRLGLRAPGGFFGRRWLYHDAIPEAPLEWHESRRHIHLLRSLGVNQDSSLDLELHPDPCFAAEAARILPDSAIVAHVSTSKPLKEWPLEHWAELVRSAQQDGFRIVLAAGPHAREREHLAELSRLRPDAPLLPPIADLGLYLAVLARAQLLVSGDTGPMHFAAGLGIPTLSLFGPSRIQQWAPIAPHARWLRASGCLCSPDQEACTAASPCLRSLTPDRVWQEIRTMLTPRGPAPVLT